MAGWSQRWPWADGLIHSISPFPPPGPRTTSYHIPQGCSQDPRVSGQVWVIVSASSSVVRTPCAILALPILPVWGSVPEPAFKSRRTSSPWHLWLPVSIQVVTAARRCACPTCPLPSPLLSLLRWACVTLFSWRKRKNMEQRRERSFSGVGCSLPRTDLQGRGATVPLVSHFLTHLLRALFVPVPLTWIVMPFLFSSFWQSPWYLL